MKFCFKCGAQLPDDSVFCSTCGTNVSESAPYNPVVSAPPAAVQGQYGPGAAPKRKKSKVLFIVLPIVLVVLIGAGVLFFTVFNTPTSKFVLANTMFFDNFMSLNADELTSRLKNEDYEASVNLTLKDISGVDETAKQFLNNLSIACDLIRVKGQGGVNLSVDMAGANVLKTSAFLTQDKFIAGIWKNDEVAKASYMDLPGDAKTPPLERLYYLFANMKPDARLKSLADKLKNAAVSSVDFSWFSVKPGKYMDLAGKADVDATAVSLSMDAKALKTFIKKVGEKLESDPTFYTDLEAYLKDNLKDLPPDAIDQIKKFFKDVDTEIPDDSFNLVWTAYQAGGKTTAIDIRLDATGEVSGAVELSLQNHAENSANTSTLQVNYKPDSGKPFAVTEQFTTEKKQDGKDISLTFDWDDGTNKAGVTCQGETTVAKKNANEYAQTGTFNINLNIPGAAGESAPGNIKFGVESTYLFGGVNFQNSRYFKLANLENSAEKASDPNEFFSMLFANAFTGALNLNGLLPDVLPGQDVLPAGTDSPEQSETPGPSPSETQTPAVTPAPTDTQAAADGSIYDVFLEFNKDNWYFYDFTAGKEDGSYVNIDNGALLLPRSDDKKTPALISKPVPFKKGDLIQVFRTFRIEDKGDYMGNLYIMYNPENSDGQPAREVVAVDYNFGPEFKGTPPDTFALYNQDASKNYQQLAAIPGLSATDLSEGITINTGTGECYWTVNDEIKSFKLDPLETGSVYLMMQSFGSDDGSVLRLTGAGLLNYQP